MADQIELQYPLGSYSLSNPPSNNTLIGDLATIQSTVNALGDEVAAKINTTTAAANLAAQKDVAETLTNKTLSIGVKLDANADQNITQYGMARQAIMNGNFDVWQRGTSVSLSVDTSGTFQCDRWADQMGKDGGTYPTLTRSVVALTAGDIPGSFAFTRLNTNGAGTSLGVNSYHIYRQRIENGTSKLCGLNKKVTLSFYARSSIANKRICPTLTQNYGTGGSPTTEEQIKGTPITLTSTWTKYTATFTTNTLVGKSFGTNNDDYLTLNFWNMWGTSIGNTSVQTSVTAESYVGAGTIDIAQVQLCAGDVALPFQPKSFEEELRACQRYYEKSFSYAVSPAQNAGLAGSEIMCSPSGSAINISSNNVAYKVTKRIVVNPVIYNPVASNSQVNVAGWGDCSGTSIGYTSDRNFGLTMTTPASAVGAKIIFHWTAEAEL